MIYLLVGENSYKVEQELARLLDGREPVERYSGADLDESTLSDSMRGMSLFCTQRTIVIKGLSEQKELWEKCLEWQSDVSSDTLLVLVERKIDKRTKTYKAFAEHAHVIVCDYLTDRQRHEAHEWLSSLAHEKAVQVSRRHIEDMVGRAQIPGEKPGAMYIDQGQLFQALQALSMLEEVTDEAIAVVLPPAPGQSVFELIEAAIARKTRTTESILAQLHTSLDPYVAFAVIVKQWLQLVSVILTQEAASSLPIHPYALNKLQSQARSIARSDAGKITQLAADLDARLKHSEVAPWDAVDRLVMAIALRK